MNQALQTKAMLQGAMNYAMADRSDPFAFSRAMTHTLNGVANYSDSHGQSQHYEAECYMETRKLPDGRQYQVTQYRNMKRP